MKTSAVLFTFILFELYSASSLAQKNVSLSESQKKISQQRIDTIASVLKIDADDIVADIGSGDGKNLVRLSKYFPPIKYYVEDVDSTNCNRTNFQKQIIQFNPEISIDSFMFVYGTVKSTELPKNFFTKVLMMAVVHEFDYKKEMFDDIKSILKPNGFIFIEEPLVAKTRKKEKDCNNPFLTEPALKKIISANGLRIVEEKVDYRDPTMYRKIYKCTVNR